MRTAMNRSYILAHIVGVGCNELNGSAESFTEEHMLNVYRETMDFFNKLYLDGIMTLDLLKYARKEMNNIMELKFANWNKEP